MPDGYAHNLGGAPLLLTLEKGVTTDQLGDAAVGAFDAGADLPGRGHIALTSKSAAINAGANDNSVSLDSVCVGGRLTVTGLAQDQLGNAVAVEVRDSGAVEYTGQDAAPANLLPLSLASFDPLTAACDVMIAKDQGGDGDDGGVTDTAANSTNTETNTQTDTSVAVGQSSVTQAASTSGGGVWGPWGILLLGVATLGVRRCRLRAVS